MQLTAPKLIAGFITALWGFASLLGAPSAFSEQPNPVPVARDYMIEPTTTTSSTIYIDPYTSACEQLSALAVNLGWPADQRTVLESIMKRESNCTPNAINRKDPNGGSRGLLQINGSWHKWLIAKGIITKPKNLLDPVVNLQAGLAIYDYGVDRYGFGWGPWGTK
jgi:soluble lytic murein transglycosylase-like protein